MGTKVIGKLTDWSDGDVGGTSFLTLEEGSNLVRCISSPYQFYIHWSTDEAGKSRKLRCALKDCPLCARDENASPHWYVAVLSRKTGKPGVIEVGPQIFKQIKGLASKKNWGDPRAYDLDINRQPKGSQPLYVVSPEPKAPLADEEKALVQAFLKECDLQKMTEAPSADELREKLGLAVSSKVNTPAAGASESSADDDFDYDFSSK